MLDSSFIQFFIPIIGLVICVLFQIGSFSFLKQIGLLKSFFTGFFCGLIWVLVVQLSFLILAKDYYGYLIIVNLLIYFTLGYCFFHFINLGETGRRIRLLRELYDTPEGLSVEQLLSRYGAEEIINLRLTRLLSNSQLILRDNRYFIGNPVMALISKAIVLMKLVILGKKSEFDK